MPEGLPRTLLVLLALAAALVFVMQRLVENLLFQPTPGVDFNPEDLGIRAESLHIETADGLRVHAYYLPPPVGSPDRALLFLHGNAGNASHRLPNAALLAAMGQAVLLLDYRGYGLSDGAPSERGLYHDAQAALAYLVETRGIPEQRIVLFGRSIGGAVAIDLAQDRPLAGVIVESSFTSLDAMARRFVGPLAGLVTRRRFDSRAKIQRLRAPLLAFHGDRDEIVPYRLGVELFEAAPEPKSFETLAGAGHNDTVQRGGAAYLARIQRFIEEVVPGRAEPAPPAGGSPEI